MTTYFHHVTKEGIQDEICLEYTITDLRPQTYFEPAEGGEVEIVNSWIEPSGKPYEMSDEECEKWSETIAEEHDHSDEYREGLSI